MIVVPEKTAFDGFDFDAPGPRTLMEEHGWAGTVTVPRAASTESMELEARNLFPVGEIREDPATGSAAASTGA